MAREKKKSEGLTGNEWMSTYSDTVTLLMTFFVLLFVITSQNNESASKVVLEALNGEGSSILQFDLYDGEVPLIGGESDIEGEGVLTKKEQTYKEAKDFLSNNQELKDIITIEDNERGVIVELKDNILFESASSQLKADSRAVLDKVSELLASIDNDILVEGHTDNVPINTYDFPSNWELSADRAVNVVRYFVEEKGLDPTRFSASGYGEYHPVAPNDTYENKAKNRRVNILIITSQEG
ncbi:OmpA/MotB family protein [Caproiciproducens sp. MSJ-32]|uniref:OmpA/MotB family protein n=1 Tax=Caproiciproducens sp. MSJ-32 TaxID=2841527 RepID=UPI001C0FF999|nr:OmpA family protein [Caproiciproducens sp. MSJ-32]MBU5454788.1 OmpA family protein [Caproiciproducens sp. MSJ-32]